METLLPSTVPISLASSSTRGGLLIPKQVSPSTKSANAAATTIPNDSYLERAGWQLNKQFSVALQYAQGLRKAHSKFTNMLKTTAQRWCVHITRSSVMKIAQLCPTYYPSVGGIELHVQEISKGLANLGFGIEILTTDPSKKLRRNEVINGLRVKRFPSWAPSNAYFFSNDLKRYLARKSDDYDIVHAYNYHAFPALYAAQKKGRNKLVFSPAYHGSAHSWFRSTLHIPYRLVGRKIFAVADRVVCFSNYEKGLVLMRFNCDEDKVVVIPPGVELHELQDMKRRSKDYRTILYAGRLEKYKGVQYLIEVLPTLDSDVILDIYGTGPYKKPLLRLASKVGVASRVRLYDLPSRQRLLEEFASADIVTLLSTHESYGLMVAEALAAGTPCIVANRSALTEWIDNRNCLGIDYPIRLDELRNLINDLLGTRAREFNRSKLWDWRETVRALVKVYEEVSS